MKRFNAVMRVCFAIVALLGLIGACSVNDNSPCWVEVLLTSFFVFLIGVIGYVIFDNLTEFVEYAASLLIDVLAATYEFCHELKLCMKCASKYKKHHDTYEKRYHITCNQYRRNDSKYQSEESNYIFTDYMKRGR